MSGTSVTGKGLGSSDKLTTKELSALENGPKIYFTGTASILGGNTSPPSSGTDVTLPYPLPGSYDNYVIILTPISTGYAYIVDRDVNSDGNFYKFTALAQTTGTVQYMVVSKGVRPQV